jgi:hypothetical protein
MSSLFVSKKKNIIHTALEIGRQYVRLVVLEKHSAGYIPTVHDEVVLAYDGQSPQIMWDEIREAIAIITKKHAINEAHIVIPATDACGAETCKIHDDQCIKMISQYARVVGEFGITPLSIQTESQAITRVATDSLNVYQSIVCVHVGVYQTVVTISKGGVPYMTKTVPHARITEYSQENPLAVRWRKDISRTLVHVYEKEGMRQQHFKKEIYISGDIPRDSIDEARFFLGEAIGNAHLEILPVWKHCFSLENHIPTIHFQDALRYAHVVGGALTNIV